MHAWDDDMQIKMLYERCMQVHGWTQTRLTNLSTTFLHGTTKLITHKTICYYH